MFIIYYNKVHNPSKDVVLNALFYIMYLYIIKLMIIVKYKTNNER